MGANRAAVIQCLLASLVNPRKIGLAWNAKIQFARDGFRGEIAFTNENWDDENTPLQDPAQRVIDAWLLLPKAFQDIVENVASPQRFGVLIYRRAGIRVHGGTVSYQHEGRIGKIPVHLVQSFFSLRSGLARKCPLGSASIRSLSRRLTRKGRAQRGFFEANFLFPALRQISAAPKKVSGHAFKRARIMYSSSVISIRGEGNPG